MWNRQALSCRLKVCSVISGLRRAAGRLFHRDGPATAKLCWLIMVRTLATRSRPVEADLRCWQPEAETTQMQNSDKYRVTYAVPLFHSHGHLLKLFRVSDDGTQPTVAICDTSGHALSAVAVQRRLFVEVITFVEHGVIHSPVQRQCCTTIHTHTHAHRPLTTKSIWQFA